MKEKNIYKIEKKLFITTSEEPKEGEWFITKTNDILKVQKPEKSYEPTGKKIILATDQDLIKDGIQPIDDKFIEWFIKNPECESIEVISEIKWKSTVYDQPDKEDGIIYKIIIPQEYPKQDLEKEMFELEQELDIPSHLRFHNSKKEPNFYEKLKEYFETTPREKVLEDWNKSAHLDNVGPTIDAFIENSNEERLMKIAHKILCDYGIKSIGEKIGILEVKKLMVKMANWQAERMYSEEDMRNAFDSAREFNSLDGIVDVHIVLPMGGDMSDLKPLHFTFNEWFDKFKKK